MQLDDRLRNLADELGADFFGVADLSLARDFILSQGGKEIASYPMAVSIGITLLDSIVDQLPNRTDTAVVIEYRHHAYDIVNERLDNIASRLSSILQKEGYRAFPVPVSKCADDERICAVFSHKPDDKYRDSLAPKNAKKVSTWASLACHPQFSSLIS